MKIWKQYPQEKPDNNDSYLVLAEHLNDKTKPILDISWYKDGQFEVENLYPWKVLMFCKESDLITSITSSVEPSDMVEALKAAKDVFDNYRDIFTDGDNEQSLNGLFYEAEKLVEAALTSKPLVTKEGE